MINNRQTLIRVNRASKIKPGEEKPMTFITLAKEMKKL